MGVEVHCDPPYVLSTRHGKQYRCEMTEEEHMELLVTLLQHPGPVVLSGYHSKLYDETLGGWHVEEHRSRNQRNQRKMEVLWMNFLPERQLKFFEEGKEGDE